MHKCSKRFIPYDDWKLFELKIDSSSMMIQTSLYKLHISLSVIWTFYSCSINFWTCGEEWTLKIDKNSCREDDWKSMARTRLRKFEEELQVAIESGMRSYSGHTQWNFVNAVFYCLDMCTTIGEEYVEHYYNDHDVQLRWLLSKIELTIWQLLIIVYELIIEYFIDNWL